MTKSRTKPTIPEPERLKRGQRKLNVRLSPEDAEHLDSVRLDGESDQDVLRRGLRGLEKSTRAREKDRVQA